jgi:hypothetical protein
MQKGRPLFAILGAGVILNPSPDVTLALRQERISIMADEIKNVFISHNQNLREEKAIFRRNDVPARTMEGLLIDEPEKRTLE